MHICKYSKQEKTGISSEAQKNLRYLMCWENWSATVDSQRELIYLKLEIWDCILWSHIRSAEGTRLKFLLRIWYHILSCFPFSIVPRTSMKKKIAHLLELFFLEPGFPEHISVLLEPPKSLNGCNAYARSVPYLQVALHGESSLITRYWTAIHCGFVVSILAVKIIALECLF